MIVLAVVATLAAVLAGVSAVYVRRTRAAFPPAGRFVDADGVRMHVEVRGSGPALVLVHGADGVLQDFPEGLRAALARAHTVLAFDRAGHGWSGRDARRLDLAGNVALLRAAVRSLGFERVRIAGHSYGALVAMRWALDAPAEVDAVIAIAPAAFPYAREARWGMAPFLVPGLGHLLAWTLIVPFGQPAARLVRARAWWPRKPAVGPGGPARAFPFVPAQFRAFAANAQAVWRDSGALAGRYREARTPLVILAGAGDRVTPSAVHARPLAEAWGAPCALIELPDGGHMLLRSHADDVVAAIARAGTMANAVVRPS